MAAGKGWFEKVRRCVRTIYFMVAMVASLLVLSAPLLVAIVDVLVPCVLISSFTCVRCHSFKDHLHKYSFKSSLTDIPLVSVIRSLIITCMFVHDLFYLNCFATRSYTIDRIAPFWRFNKIKIELDFANLVWLLFLGTFMPAFGILFSMSFASNKSSL